MTSWIVQGHFPPCAAVCVVGLRHTATVPMDQLTRHSLDPSGSDGTRDADHSRHE